MNLLTLDQAIDKTGYCYKEYGHYTYGLLQSAANNRKGLAPAHWMKCAILNLILLVKPDMLAIEGVHLGKNVDTLIELAELRGRILSVCEDMSLPVITISSPDMMKYLHLRVGTNRVAKKKRARQTATMLVYGNAYALDGKNKLIQEDMADAIVLYEIAEARLNLERMVAESEGQ